MEKYSAVLKRRARAFLESAKADFDRGGYDLVLFYVEQFSALPQVSTLPEARRLP